MIDPVLDFADTNPGVGVCDFSAGSDRPSSLRTTIQEADAASGSDIIVFGILAGERNPSTVVVTIKPQSPLPAVIDQVTINGYIQPGASPNTKTVNDDAMLKIKLNGSKVLFTGLRIQNSSGSVIRGQALSDSLGTSLPVNSSDGVFVTSDASQTVVGGATLDKRNVTSGNGGTFIDGSDGSLVKGNYVGTDNNGTLPSANHSFFGGVFVQSASGTTVGDTTGSPRDTSEFSTPRTATSA